MDPSWTECRYCPPGGPPLPPGGNPQSSKGRTVIESGNPYATPAAGGFTKGATLLEDTNRPSPKGATVVEDASGKGKTTYEKPRTIFDPGTSATAPNRKKLVGWLVTFTHDPAGQDYRIREGRNVIGTAADSDIRLNEAFISSRHALLIYQDGQFMIRDEGSENGTYVNGENIFLKGGGVTLQEGDCVKIGRSEMILYTIKRETT